MDRHDLIKLLENSTQHRYVYHFTDRENFRSIKKHGLLSKKTMQEQGIIPPKPGGNEWSWDADAYKGLTSYVNLCFTMSHPMRKRALNEGRLSDAPYLAIDPSILLTPGVKISLDVANKRGVKIYDIDEAVSQMDTEVLYTRTDWNDATIRQRLCAAEKYELLVPDRIPVSMIKGIMKR